MTSGRLVSAGIPKNHFNHVFLDEAGHAMEPGACVALAGNTVEPVISLVQKGVSLKLINCV